jgi:hypothetical protein
VYRTGTTPWTKPTGPEVYRELKELRQTFGHKLNIVWKDLDPKIRDFLDSKGVPWTTIDVVRFIEVGVGEAVGPVVLWIGVASETALYEDAQTSANGHLELFKEFDITDIEFEYRESIYTRSAGPNLLKPVSDFQPSTSAVLLLLRSGSPSLPRPHLTLRVLGLYLTEGCDSKKVLPVTARHVLFPLNEKANVDYARTNTSTPRPYVLLLGAKAFDDFVKSVKIRIRQYGIKFEFQNQQIKKLRVREAARDLKKIQRLLDEAIEAIEALEGLHDEVEGK